MGRYARSSITLTDSNGNPWRISVGTDGNLVHTDATPPATKAGLQFTPAATGGSDAWDYTTPQTFTINDGTATTTVLLTGDLVDVDGVAAAVDAALGAAYDVYADDSFVFIDAAVAGAKTFTVGGANAAAITGSAGYETWAGTAGTA